MLDCYNTSRLPSVQRRALTRDGKTLQASRAVTMVDGLPRAASCQTEAVICILVLCKRQVWENSVARERDRLQFSKNIKILENLENFEQNWCLQRKIEHLAWTRCSTSWSMSLREFKTFMNFGGPAGYPGVMSDITWLVETRYFSLGEQYYSTAGANWTRMAKQLFRRSWYRNGQCSRSNGQI